VVRYLLFSLLGAALMAGCASRPYPPLSDEVEESADDAAVVATDIFPEWEADEAESSLPPPVSQEVFPPPPDPESLPEAEKRQLDIRLAQQRFNYFEDDVLVWTGPISSGRKEHPTPKGSYRVESKMRHKRSGSYTNYFEQPTPMPYALQFRGPYWVHEGYVTGKPESHGCVRLRHADAKFVFERIKEGDRIVVGD
jgi:hypothetical protein